MSYKKLMISVFNTLPDMNHDASDARDSSDSYAGGGRKDAQTGDRSVPSFSVCNNKDTVVG